MTSTMTQPTLHPAADRSAAAPTSRTGDPSPAPAVRGARATLAACFLGMFVVTLDAVVVNLALPSIRAELSTGMAGVQWIVDAYTLAVAALLLAGGAMADRTGARRAFGLGMTGFVAASVACALAPSLGWLLGARALQGIAAALLMPTSMSLIGQVFTEPAAKARAVGLWALGGAVASSAGPVVGGALTAVSWRLIFWINLPVGLVTLLLLVRTPRSPQLRHPFDLPGLLLSVLAMSALTFGAIESGERGLTGPLVLVSLGTAAAAGLALVGWERRSRHPMVPPTLLADPLVATVTAVGFVFMACYYGTPFVMSLVLQQHGLSTLATGLVFLPMMLVGLVLTPLSARAVERYGRRTVVIAGLLAMTAGVLGLALAAGEGPRWLTSLLMVLVGLGGPAVMPPVTAALLGAVDPGRAGTASGVLNTSRQVGGALAVAVFGALLTWQQGTGLRVSMLLCAGALVLVAALVRRTLPARARTS